MFYLAFVSKSGKVWSVLLLSNVFPALKWTLFYFYFAANVSMYSVPFWFLKNVGLYNTFQRNSITVSWFTKIDWIMELKINLLYLLSFPSFNIFLLMQSFVRYFAKSHKLFPWRRKPSSVLRNVWVFVFHVLKMISLYPVSVFVGQFDYDFFLGAETNGIERLRIKLVWAPGA